jgi:hypothetical protein
MKNVKIILLIIIFFSALTGFSQAKKKANKETDAFRYEISCEGEGVPGTYLVKIWSYSKKPVVAAEQTKKNAVHGIIFKGYPGLGTKCQSQRALASSPTIEHEQRDFFKKFFSDGGDYMKYVTTSGVPQTIKVGKEYKVGVVVSVSKDQLRKDLEAAGIIKGLSSGF